MSSGGRKRSAFATAGGGEVNVSEEALRKAQRVLGRDAAPAARSNAKENVAPQVPVATASTGSKVSKFATARGSVVTVSEEALRKADALFSTSTTSPHHTTSTSDDTAPTILQRAPAAKASRFATASGGIVTISEKARRKAQALFDGGAPSSGSSANASANVSASVRGGPMHGTPPLLAPVPVPMPKGRQASRFATAKGSAVSVSEEAIARGSAVLQAASGGGGSSSNSGGGGGSSSGSDYPVADVLSMPQHQSAWTPYGEMVCTPEPEATHMRAPTSAPPAAPAPPPAPPPPITRAAPMTRHVVASVAVAPPPAPAPAQPQQQPQQQQQQQQRPHPQPRPLLSAPREGRAVVAVDCPHPLVTPSLTRAAVRERERTQRSLLAGTGVVGTGVVARVTEVAMAVSSANAANVAFDLSTGLPSLINGGVGGGEGEGSGSLTSLVTGLVEVRAGYVIPVGSELHCWIGMGVRWIVWTLAALERRGRMPSIPRGRLLCFHHVAAEVLRRFDNYRAGISGSRRERGGAVVGGEQHQHQHPSKTPARSQSRAKGTGTGRTPGAPTRKLTSAQSPLQRCTGIATFVWPLVLCLAVAGPSRQQQQQQQQQQPAETGGGVVLEASDGWWWTRVRIDKELTALFSAGVLRDGCKVVVFGATFDTGDRGQAAMCLTYNNVRRARSDAGLGYIPPRHLNRGLSARSVKLGGGPVYALRGVVVYTGHDMSRFVNQAVEGGGGGMRSACLSADEARLLGQKLEAARYTEETSLQHHPSLSLEALLDDMGCDQRMIGLIRSLETGQDPHGGLSGEDEVEVRRVRERLPQTRDFALQDLMSDRMRRNAWKETRQRDVLCRCALSADLFWLRMVTSSGGGGGGGLRPGDHIVMTNLKPLHSMGSVRVFVTGANSSVKTLTDVPALTPEAEAEAVGGGGDLPTRALTCLRDVGRTTLPTEVTFYARVISWQRTLSAGGACVDFNVQCTDISRTIVSLTFSYPAVAETVITKWLEPGIAVLVELALCRSFDRKYDVISATRHDRTRLMPLPKDSPLAVAAGAAAGWGGLLASDTLLAEERLRYGALSSGKTLFEWTGEVSAHEHAERSESCTRTSTSGVTLMLSKRRKSGGVQSVIVRFRDGTLRAMEVPASVDLPECLAGGGGAAAAAMTGDDAAAASATEDGGGGGRPGVLVSQDTDAFGFTLGTFDVVSSEVWDFNPATDEMEAKCRLVWVRESVGSAGTGAVGAGAADATGAAGMGIGDPSRRVTM